jgi:Family of unknown function (DUF5955)
MGDKYNIKSIDNVQGLQIGSGGSQVNNFRTVSRAEQRQLVEELVRQARAHAGELTAPEKLESAAVELDTELGRDEPRESRLRSLLGRLTVAAGGVTAVAEAVSKVRQAIGLDG